MSIYTSNSSKTLPNFIFNIWFFYIWFHRQSVLLILSIWIFSRMNLFNFHLYFLFFFFISFLFLSQFLWICHLNIIPYISTNWNNYRKINGKNFYIGLYEKNSRLNTNLVFLHQNTLMNSWSLFYKSSI